MDKSPICFFSNHLDKLSDLLFESFFHEESKPFDKKIVVVPSGSCKSYLMERLALSKYQVASGIKILTLGEMISFLCDRSLPSEKKIPSLLELSFLIESEIQAIIKNEDSFAEKKAFQPVREFLKIEQKKDGLQRLPGFCDKVALSFSTSDVWKSLAKEPWVKILQDRVYSENWTLPSKILQDSCDYSFYLFHMSFLPTVYFDFFTRADAVFYELSPTEFFWEDAYSDKERASYLKKLEKRGVKAHLQEEWNAYALQENRLLSNLGKMGREFSRMLQEKAQCYEFYLPFPQGDLGVLPSLQRNILLLESKEEKQEVILDGSITVHVASSLYREVEICKQEICRFLNEDKTLQPDDIVVMAVDMEKYFPFLEMVFIADEPKIPLQVEDVVSLHTSQCKEALHSLLKVAEGNFVKEDVLVFFSHPKFADKLGIDKKQTAKVAKWLESVYLQNETGYDWDAALTQLLLGLIVSPSEDVVEIEDKAISPVEVAEEDRDLLCQLIQTIQSLRVDLAPIVEGRQQTLKDWVFLMIFIMNKYLILEESDENLITELQSFCFSLKDKVHELFPFSSVKRALENVFSKTEKIFYSSERNAVRFCKFENGKFTNKKVIYLLGMDEESFPRKEMKDMFFSFEGYKPSRADVDRNLFLQAIVCAQQALLMSYVRFSSEDHKEQKSSFVVQELFHFLDRLYEKSGKESFSEHCTFFHPSLGFDQRYFLQKSPFVSYSKSSFEQRLSAEAGKKEREPFLGSKKSKEVEDDTIEIKDLTSFAKDPIKYYLRKKVGLYFGSFQKEEEFQIGGLDRYLLRKNMHRKTKPELISFAKAKGMIPAGFLGEITEKQIEEEQAVFLSLLDELEILPESIYTVVLQKGLKTPKWETGHLLYLPALEISCGGRKISIIGKIEGVTKKGLIAFGKGEKKDMAKMWPAFLVYLAHPHIQEETKRALFFGEKAKSYTFEGKAVLFLEKYLNYFFFAKDEMSPCLPSWVEGICEGDVGKLSKEIKKEIEGDLSSFREDIKFIQGRDAFFDAKNLCGLWKDKAYEVFSPLLEGNYETV